VRAKRFLRNNPGNTKKRRNFGALQRNPLLAGPNSYYAYTGRTINRLAALHSRSTRSVFGKTTWKYEPKPGGMRVKRGDSNFTGAQVREDLIGALTFRIAPKIPTNVISRLQLPGPDALGRIVGGGTRNQIVLSGGKTSYARPMLSPILDYYIRVRVPKSVNAFIGRNLNRIIRSRVGQEVKGRYGR
jgi:hypothetical protein